MTVYNLGKDSLMLNDVGMSQVIDTLTYVSGKLVEQKFYEIPFADYVPTVIGEGAFSDEMLYYTNFADSEGFETGLVSNTGRTASLEQVDTHYEAIKGKPQFWAKKTNYTVLELKQALKMQNLPSLIERREKVRQKEWQLGIQKVAFLGVTGQSEGLLNNSSITADTSTLTVKLSAATSSQLNSFVSTIVGLYVANTAGVILPDTFVIPLSDYVGLGSTVDASFPIKTKMDFLMEAFKGATGNENFKILPCFYCDKANYDGTNNVYALYHRDEEDLVYNINVDYTVTQFASRDNFNWESAGYGQFTPVIFKRPETIYYLKNNA